RSFRRVRSSLVLCICSFPGDRSLQPVFAVTDHSCYLELGLRRRCLLRRAVATVCLPFTFASSFRGRRR
ncbi:hypothetical protein S245_048513, partial [Arachis hypogaea]